MWRWFLELNATRTIGGHVPNPISFQEIEAWARLNWVDDLTPFDVSVLRRLDAAMLKHWHDNRQAASQGDGPALVSAADTDGVKGVLSKFKQPRKAKR